MKRLPAIALGLAIGLVAGEMWVRWGRWQPPQQIVRGFGLHAVDGVPVWEVSSDRNHRDCVERHPERTRILFFGSSITYGSDLAAEEAFTSGLETELNRMRPDPGFCVLNFAQNGFSFEQKYALARVEIPRYRPALVLWENWVEWMDYTLIGDTAYGTSGFKVRPDGFIGIAGVPGGLNRFLFLHSRAYEYLTLTFGERTGRPPEQEEAAAFVRSRLVKVPELAAAAGAKLAFYLATPLDRPFADTAASPPGWHRVLLDFAAARGVASYTLQRELIDQDYRAVRLDPCCHFNAAGHRALVPVMQRIVLEQLDGNARPSS